MISLFYNFLITFILELIIFYVFIRKNYFKTLCYVLLINLFTWPIANFIYSVWQNIFIIEIGVFIIEGILIMLMFELKWRKAFLISFITNLISFLGGIFLLYHI